MADKVTLTNLANLQNETTAVNAINANNAAIITAMNNTLSRDGTTPNTMGASLDMNSNHILNLPAPTSQNDPIRLQDARTLGNGGTITVNPMPAGGSTGTFLLKNSAADFDTTWGTNITATNGLSLNSGTTPGQGGLFASGTVALGSMSPSGLSQGVLRISATGSSLIGFNMVNTLTGTLGGGALAEANFLNVTDACNTLAAPGGNYQDISLFHQVNNTSAAGSRSAIGVDITVSVTTANKANSFNPSYGAATFSAFASANDGGTAGTKWGNLYGTNPTAALLTGATNWAGIASEEVNITCQTGTSVQDKSGIAITQTADDAVGGSRTDCALLFTNQGGAVGWTNVIQFDNVKGVTPVATTGTYIKTVGSQNAGVGIDFTSVTFATAALKTSGFTVTPVGDVQVNRGSSDRVEVFVQNVSTGTNSAPQFRLKNDVGDDAQYGLASGGFNTFGALVARNVFLYSLRPIVIMSDGNEVKFASGNHGGAETARFTPNQGLAIGSTTDPGQGCLKITGHIETSPVVTSSLTSYSVAGTDVSVTFTSTAAVTVTMPSASTFGGRWLYFKATGAGGSVISGASNVLPLASTTAGTAILASSGKFAQLHSDGTNWNIMAAN